MKVSSPDTQNDRSDSTFRERLRFVIWLAAYSVGADSAKDLALIIGKRPDQFTKWLNGSTRPDIDNVRLIAESVGVNTLWLDHPESAGSVEPEWFGAWVAAQRQRAEVRASKTKRTRKGGSFVARVGKAKPT